MLVPPSLKSFVAGARLLRAVLRMASSSRTRACNAAINASDDSSSGDDLVAARSSASDSRSASLVGGHTWREEEVANDSVRGLNGVSQRDGGADIFEIAVREALRTKKGVISSGSRDICVRQARRLTN
eukprot:scaffold55785_cov46-Phaeocystis_antarctica.AAC.2